MIEKALEKIVIVAKRYTDFYSIEHKRVGTGILEYLFRHSLDTCSDVISMGALDTIGRSSLKVNSLSISRKVAIVICLFRLIAYRYLRSAHQS